MMRARGDEQLKGIAVVQMSQARSMWPTGKRSGALVLLLLALTLIALIAPSTGGASYSSSAGGEPPVTNTATNSHFFDWTAQGNMRFCVNVYRNSSLFERGCIPSASSYYTDGSSGTLSQTENSLADGTLVGVYPLQCQEGTFVCLSCSFDFCHSSTLIDLNQPVLTVYAAGTAVYTNNPQIPMHIDYNDALSHPWFAGGDAAAVFVCARRDRACTNADPHNYEPNCSHANLTRFAAPGNAKVNSFDCTFNFGSEADGPVYLCASAADQSIPDPDPTAIEPSTLPTHVNQFVNPATGTGWTAGSANLAENSCGSVMLDRAPPAINVQASDTTPATGDLVTLSASSSDGLSGVSGPYTWDFGDNTPSKQGASITHTYGNPGTYHVTVTTHDGAGNEGSTGVDLIVTTEKGGTGDEGTVIAKPPSKSEIGGKDGTQAASLGELNVIAPKKHRLGKKLTPILLTLIAANPGAFQAALTKGSKTVSKGAGVLATAGTFGFKLQLPKRLVTGIYKLQLTFVPDGATTGSTKTISIKFFRPRARKHRRVARRPSPGTEGPVNVDAGPPLAAGYGG
jgi:plastocyanin